jgi:hypothetical protein
MTKDMRNMGCTKCLKFGENIHFCRTCGNAPPSHIRNDQIIRFIRARERKKDE